MSDDESSATLSAQEMTKMLMKLNEKIDAIASGSSSDTTTSDEILTRQVRKRSREHSPESGSDVDDDPESVQEDENIGGKKPRTFSVSSPTKAFLKTSFCLPRPVENTTRRMWLAKFGLPEGDEARCPKMDALIKGELVKDSIDADRRLSRLQNFTLDAAGPMVAALEELTTKDKPNVEVVTSAIQHSLLLIGNASAQFSKERRTRALGKLNPDLKTLAEDEDFSESQPYLFGRGFEKKAKQRTEALECLRRATSKEQRSSGSSSFRTKRFFQGNRPQQNGGNGGGNYNRQQNYQYQNYQYQNYQYQNRGYRPKNYYNQGQNKQSGVKKTQQ